MTASERGAHVGLCTDDTGENDDHSSEGDRDESAQLLVCDIRGNGRQEDVDVNTSVYCETRDTLKAEKIAKTYGQAGTYNDGTTKSSESDADSPEDILSPEYTEMLEEAFVANHLYGNSPPSVIEAVHSIILQAQVRCFLPLTHPSDYTYTWRHLACWIPFFIAHTEHCSV